VRTILDFLKRAKEGEGEATRPSMSCLA